MVGSAGGAEFQLGVFGGLLVLAIVAVVLSAALYPTQWGLFVCTCILPSAATSLGPMGSEYACIIVLNEVLPYVLLPVTAAACAAIGDDEELRYETSSASR
jgi:hypothetical protein